MNTEQNKGSPGLLSRAQDHQVVSPWVSKTWMFPESSVGSLVLAMPLSILHAVSLFSYLLFQGAPSLHVVLLQPVWIHFSVLDNVSPTRVTWGPQGLEGAGVRVGIKGIQLLGLVLWGCFFLVGKIYWGDFVSFWSTESGYASSKKEHELEKRRTVLSVQKCLSGKAHTSQAVTWKSCFSPSLLDLCFVLLPPGLHLQQLHLSWLQHSLALGRGICWDLFNTLWFLPSP